MSETSETGETGETMDGQGAPHVDQSSIAAVLTVIAERVRQRAKRRANTLPMIATLGANALAIELRMRAEDHEAIAAAAGMQYVSQLRRIADALPKAASEGVAFIIQADAKFAEAVAKAAEAANGGKRDAVASETADETADGTK